MNQSHKLFIVGCCVVGFAAFVGCKESNGTAKKDKSGIIGKTTNEIGEFDAEADGGKEAGDVKINPANPLYALKGYEHAAKKIASLGIDHAVQLFHAEHGRYPKSHEEFMEKIIRRNNMQLPKLPGKQRYSYDVENHKLVILEAEAE